MSTYSSVSRPGRRVGRVVHPPQAAADHLLAQQLAAERAQPEDVRHVVRVPAFGQHGHGDHAAHMLARLRPACRRVATILPQFLGGLLARGLRVVAFGRGQQLGVDADRVLLRPRVLAKLREARHAAAVALLRLRLALAASVRRPPRRHRPRPSASTRSPSPRRKSCGRSARRCRCCRRRRSSPAGCAPGPASPPGSARSRSFHWPASVSSASSRLAVHHLGLRLAARSAARRLAGRRVTCSHSLKYFGSGRPGVVGRRQARNLGDAALDGVHQPEVAHDPGKGRAFRVAAAVEVERRGRQIHAEGRCRRRR